MGPGAPGRGAGVAARSEGEAPGARPGTGLDGALVPAGVVTGSVGGLRAAARFPDATGVAAARGGVGFAAGTTAWGGAGGFWPPSTLTSITRAFGGAVRGAGSVSNTPPAMACSTSEAVTNGLNMGAS